MAAPLQVIVSSDSGSQLWNSTVFDPHSGSSLLSYRGGNSAARSLCVLNGEYMLSAQLGKNFINVWEIQRKDQLQQKLVCPGVVTCLTTSPDGLFLAAGVSEAVYLWEMWELSSGEMLLSVLFDVEIMSVTFDPSEYFLFCGGSDGNIFQVSLCSQSLSRDKSFQSDNDGNQVFKGHRNLVTCLSVSMDGTLLLSGSHDETVRLWDIQSKQSIRCFAHKGPVTNAVIMAAPSNMFLPDSRPAVPLPRFSRHLHASEGDAGESGEVCVRLGLYTQEEDETYLQKSDRLNSLMNAVTDKSVFGDGENTKVRVAELEEEVQTLKKVNKDLYDFSSQLLTKPT
ncbi:WD repeat-containing protein 18 [Scomber scombrus]|uniref:WD repeat-containing protein 18 n=1 Tax=Scomber scombrus TaxID=13677 RepID=A0AAV1Q508_SCOSC